MHVFCSPEVVYNMSQAVSYELRAFYNDDIRQGIHGKSGLSCFSPVINIMRHPLWGRNQVKTVVIIGLLLMKFSYVTGQCLSYVPDAYFPVSYNTASTMDMQFMYDKKLDVLVL